MNQGLPQTTPLSAKGGQQQAPPLQQILIATKDMQTAEQHRRQLAGSGLRIVARRKLSGLGLVLSTYRYPDGTDVADLLARLQNDLPGVPLELNQRYELLSTDARSYGQRLVGAKVPSNCQQPVTLGMLDSSVATEVPALAGSQIERHDVTGKTPLSTKHGTAVATLLVSGHSQFPGLLPAARLYAVNVFALENEQLSTRTDWLLAGLNHLATRSPTPSVVNMSFGGAKSALLAQVLQNLSPGIWFVAAAGNNGNQQRVYPAAYPSVIAVGGINAKRRRASQSSYGDHLMVVAPGEDVWTSNGKGHGFYASGTSYAAPFVTASLTLAKDAHGQLQRYFDTLLDLGEPGHDPQFGHGLVSFKGLCQQ